MKAEEINAVAAIYDYAFKTGRNPDDVASEWEQKALQYFGAGVKKAIKSGMTEEIKECARSIYADYPTECFKPEYRKIKKSPTGDVPKIEKLCARFGCERVKKAIGDYVARGAYTQDLCRALKSVEQSILDEDFCKDTQFKLELDQVRPDF